MANESVLDAGLARAPTAGEDDEAVAEELDRVAGERYVETEAVARLAGLCLKDVALLGIFCWH